MTIPSRLSQIQQFVRSRTGLSTLFGIALLGLAAVLPGALASLAAALVGGLFLLAGLSLRLMHLESRSADGYALEASTRVLQASLTELEQRVSQEEATTRASAERAERLESLPAAVAALEQATDALARKKTSSEAFAALSARFDALEARAEHVDDRFEAIEEAQANSLDRLGALEHATEAELRNIRSQRHVAEALVRVSAARERVLRRQRPPTREQPTVDLKRMLDRTRPAVTVVVTCFDHEIFIGECLESVRNQTFADFECIVVDDASTDRSVERAREAIELDDRFTVIRHPENRGPSAARNTGLRHATAPFICFLDSDDLFLRANLERRLNALLAVTSPLVAGVFSGVEPAAADVQLAALPEAIDWRPPAPKNLLNTRGENPFNLHAPLLRTDVMRSSGGFDESMRSGAEDWELWLRLMRNGFAFDPVPHKLAIYRQKPSTAAWRSAPTGFRQASTRLLHGVNEVADPRWRVANSPFFFEEPLASYETRLSVAKRDFIFLGLAALADDDEELNRALNTLPTGVPGLMAEDELANNLYAGIRRSLGLTPEESQAIRHELESLRDLLIEHARETLQTTVAEPIIPRRRRGAVEAVKLFWWQTGIGAPGHGNFGDELSPLLVSLVSGREVEWADKDACELVALGSVLDLVVASEHRCPATWGSGFIRAGTTTGAGLHISSTRGFLSSQRCGFIGGIGDPALLTRYLDVRPGQKYRVGLVPHYVDWDLPIVTRFTDEVPGSIVINPLSAPMDVVNAVAGCDFIFSSSLHGLIVADSLGVPNAWTELSGNVVGEGYKYADYYSCFPIDRPEAIRPNAPSELEALIPELAAEYSRPGLDALIAGVVDSFPTHI